MKHVAWIAVWLTLVGWTAGCTGEGPCLEDMACWNCHTMGNEVCK